MMCSPRLPAHVPLTLSASQKSDHRLAVKVATSSLLLTHTGTSCQGTACKVWSLMIFYFFNVFRDVILCVAKLCRWGKLGLTFIPMPRSSEKESQSLTFSSLFFCWLKNTHKRRSRSTLLFLGSSHSTGIQTLPAMFLSIHPNRWPLVLIHWQAIHQGQQSPVGLVQDACLCFCHSAGGVSHCSLGLSLFWPGRIGVIGCTGECRLPHDPRAGLICNYLLQCSGRLQFAPVQDVDYLVYWDGRAAHMRVHMRTPANTHTHIHAKTRTQRHALPRRDSDEFPLCSTWLTEAAMFLIRFSCRGIVKFLIKPLCATCNPRTGLH